MAPRVIEVEPERLDRWLAAFAERHGPAVTSSEPAPGGEVIHALAADGSSIVATPFTYDPLGVVLVRRGGYAVALAIGETIGAAKVGTRHVQSRTAAGGWSQQRFARRRGKQADELVAAVVAHARRILLGDDESPPPDASGIPTALLLGGDRALVREVLGTPGLRALRGLPTRGLYDLPDPKRGVLSTALRRCRAYRVRLSESTAPGQRPD